MGLWHYRGPDGVEHGPFTSGDIYDWYCQKFYDGSLPVSTGDDGLPGPSRLRCNQ